jgi:PAS domain S-box-containing protein
MTPPTEHSPSPTPDAAATKAAVPAWRAESGWRLLDSPRTGLAIIVIGILVSSMAALIAAREELREEHMLWQADTAPFRSAVEREIGKYSALRAVAQLATVPLATDAGNGVKTQVLGETLERLYPAVNFIAFVRVVSRDAADDYLRRRGIKAASRGGPPAANGSATEGPAWHYFLESYSPTSPRGFAVGTDLATIPEFARNLERATKMDSLLVTRQRAEQGRSLPGALVLFGIERPSSVASQAAISSKPAGTEARQHALHPAVAPVTTRPESRPTKARTPLQEPFGFLIVGIDMSRLIRESMHELPMSWHARLTAFPETNGSQIEADKAEEGKMLFDSHLEMPPGMVFQPVRPSLRMDPYRFEAWGSRLLLEMEGHEENAYPFLDVMPWLALISGLLLTAAVYAVFMRIRNARSRERSLAHEVRTSTERFRDIVETSSDWIWEMDAQFRFTYLSPTTNTMLGYSSAELLGAGAASLLSTANGDGVAAQLFPLKFPLKNSEVASYTGFERRLRHKYGKEVVVESAGTAIRDMQGAVIGYRGIDRDVTQQREFRQRLSQLHEDLARHIQSNLAGQLLSGLAHELNQPLAAILTYNQTCLRLLKSGNADPAEIVAAMQSTADNVGHARDILQRLRRFTVRREPHAVPTPLLPLVENCLALIAIRLRSLSVEARVNIFATLPAVLADPILATQVFLNVFNNAIDAMRESEVRRITVSARVLNGRVVRVRIADSGPGIVPENLSRLFDAYFTTKPDGTGIGLPLCRSIIEAMGGAITVSSELGKGAVVELNFPVARNPAGKDGESGADHSLD